MKTTLFPPRVISSLALALVVTGVQPCQSHIHHIDSVSISSLKKELQSNWSCSKPLGSESVSISFGIGADGRIYDTSIEHHSRDIQVDAECLEAICTLSPVPKLPSGNDGRLDHGLVIFGGRNASVHPSFNGSDVTDYLRNQPATAAVSESGARQFVLIHSIPLRVLALYPGLYSKEELLNPKNLIKVDAGLSPFPGPSQGETWAIQPKFVGTTREYYARWSNFFITHPRATKTELEDFAENTRKLTPGVMGV